jgi:hypothetical protein
MRWCSFRIGDAVRGAGRRMGWTSPAVAFMEHCSSCVDGGLWQQQGRREEEGRRWLGLRRRLSRPWRATRGPKNTGNDMKILRTSNQKKTTSCIVIKITTPSFSFFLSLLIFELCLIIYLINFIKLLYILL